MIRSKEVPGVMVLTLIFALLSGEQTAASSSQYAANKLSLCESFSDEDFKQDANAVPEFNFYIAAQNRLQADIPYDSDDKVRAEIDDHFRLADSEHVKCKNYTVKKGFISTSDAAKRFSESLYDIRGCGKSALDKLLDQNKKLMSQKAQGQKSDFIKPSPSTGIEVNQGPSVVMRLNWASDFYERSNKRILYLSNGASNPTETFGEAIFKLKSAKGTPVIKKVRVSNADSENFCGSILALERRLNALYEQEQSQLLAKKTVDGVQECLRWLSGSREFNGRPAGTGLLSYLKIEPVSAGKLNFDANRTEQKEKQHEDGSKTISLHPLQSVDFVSLTRDSNDRLIAAELYTPGVRQSKFGNEMFFNKKIRFGYETGRCQPQMIEYGDSKGQFKITRSACAKISPLIAKSANSEATREAVDEFVDEHDLHDILKKWREPATSGAAQAPVDRVRTVDWFCSQFDPYLE